MATEDQAPTGHSYRGWVHPEACKECGEVIGLEDRIAVITGLITETVMGRRITVSDGRAVPIHARHWLGGRRGWRLVEWGTLGKWQEQMGP